MSEQKPNAKISLPQNLLGQAQPYADRALRALFGVTQNWKAHNDIVKNNYALGLGYLSGGYIRDAIFRFRLVVLFDPKHAQAWYSLGRSYLDAGKPGKASHALQKALELKPGWDEAIYMLAIAGGAKTPPNELPKKMPLSLSLPHFDELAASYTPQQLETYGYQGHRLLADAVRQTLVPGRIDHAVLELGVGSGLCGPLMRDIAAEMTGVDFSAPMLAEAMKLQDAGGKKLYDALIRREAGEFLHEASAAAYDIVLAAGLFSYIGELTTIFRDAARLLKGGGRFGFTVDALDGEGYRFDPVAGRFRFSVAYLRSLAAANGLTELTFNEAAAYPDQRSYLCVFGK